MSYQVIARKWRPQSFEEVTGQEHITRTLRNAIEHQRLHHAYLFSGARGVGKTTTARLLAKAVNCHRSPDPTSTPCRATDADICPSCLEISESRSMDVLEIDAASNTQVDKVRDTIIDPINIAPARDRFKVFIIDEVHMLSNASFNALLKTLEEPPPRVLFIMATTESHKIPGTILSRCQQFEFRTISTARIEERLRLIAEAEKITVTDDALREVARAGEGSMRDAQSAFDQVISFSGAEIRVEDVETALGIAGSEMLLRVINSISTGQPAEALAVVDDLVMRGHDLRNFCRDLMSSVRDLLVAKVAGDSADLLDASTVRAREIAKRATEFSESDLVRFFHSLTETETSLRTSAHPRFQLEVGLVKLIEMRRLVPVDDLVARLRNLEESLRSARALTPENLPSKSGGGPAGAGGTRSSGPSRTTSRGGSAFASARGDSEPEAAHGLSHGEEGESPSDGARKPVLTLVQTGAPVSRVGGVRHIAEANLDGASKREAQPAPRAGDEESGLAQTDGGDAIAAIKAELEKRRRMFLLTALDAARRVTIEAGEFRANFAPEARHLHDNLAKPDSLKVLREVCQTVAGRELKIVLTVGAGESSSGGAAVEGTRGPAEDPAPDEKQALRAIAEQHPVVKELLATFRGEIIDVRRTDGS